MVKTLEGITGMLPLISESMHNRFYVLTAYCFLRSIRINGSKQEWKAPRNLVIARLEEVLILGMMTFLESKSLETKIFCA